MKEIFKEQFKTILSKKVNGNLFTLQIIAIPDQNYKFVENYDYIISGPNWLSGHLKAQGMNELEIFDYFESCSMSDVADAWDAHHERLSNC